MSRQFRLLVLILGAVTLVGPALRMRAQPPAATPAYRIYPVTTDLQRELMFVPASVVVLLDTMDALKDNEISLDALKLEDLRKALQPHKKADARLHFTLVFPNRNSGQSPGQNILRYVAIGFGHEAGFPKVTAEMHNPGSTMTWAEYAATLAAKPGQPAGDEAAAANDLVKSFPVRTELSRHLTANSDCAVVIVPSLAKEQGVLPEKVREAAADMVGKLKLAGKTQVTFITRHTPEEDRQKLIAEFNQLARTMGFETCSVTFR